MRQFSVTAFLLIAAVLAGIAYDVDSYDGSQEKEVNSSAPASKGDRLLMPQETAAAVDPKVITAQAWHEQVIAEYAAIEEAVGTIEKRPKPAIIADAEEVTPAHITASASADQIESEIGKLSLFDLKSGTQRELKRLGCYEARVDGLWGKRSRTAVRRFNKVTGSIWKARPAPDLLQVLKGAPDNLCKPACQAGAKEENCPASIANKPNDPEVKKEQHEVRAYLPPWMRANNIASADAYDLTGIQGGSVNSAATVVQTDRAAEVRSRTAQRTNDRSRSTGRMSRQRSHSNWLPDGWPGSSH